MQPENSSLPSPKPYSKPEVRAVVLVPSEYVLGACFTASSMSAFEGACGGEFTDCMYGAVRAN